MVLDCRPPLLPVSMDIQPRRFGLRLCPPRLEPSLPNVGGDLLSLICPELGVTPLTDPGTDLEDELPTPAASPVTVDHGAAPLSTQADVDIDLVRILVEVGTLPAMVTPLSYLEGGGAYRDSGGVSCTRDC